jgi:hypothetical protein
MQSNTPHSNSVSVAIESVFEKVKVSFLQIRVVTIAMALTAHRVGETLVLQPNQVGLIFSITLAALMLGAMSLSPFSYLMGRRRVLLEYRSKTLFLWLTFFCFICLYFLMSWLPNLVINSGLSESQGVFASLALNAGGVLGIILLGWLTARIPFSYLIGSFLCIRLKYAHWSRLGHRLGSYWRSSWALYWRNTNHQWLLHGV